MCVFPLFPLVRRKTPGYHDDANFNGTILMRPSILIHSGADLHYKQALGALDSHIEEL
jgi:hypothetical protein